ncbi:MAG: aminopeptidase [Solirubrobacterales bacterium]
MIDPRVANLARILVGYSTRVGEGETCLIEASTAAEPLVAAVYEEVLRAGANPVVSLSLEDQSAIYYREATDAQLEWISPLSEWAAEQSDCRIAIGADTNTRQLSGVAPERQTKRQAATRHLMERTLKRAAEGTHRWVYTLYPTNAYASDAEMSLREFEDFYFHACLADDGDPLGAWRRASDECRRLAEWVEGHEEVRITAPGTDLRLGIAGRRVIPCDGEHNMPDGEFFTGPIEDSVEGEVSFDLPAMIGGREVAGVRLRFDAGRVVDAGAERGEEFLIELLDTDEGARRVGELGIGTNYGIDRGTRDVLLDEKIGGTVHLAVGASYPESGGTNESAVHTDMVCDLRRGGRLEVDGELAQQDGKFVI